MSKDDKRKFDATLKDGRVVSLTVKEPNNQDMQGAEFEYSKMFNKAIIGGILPHSRLLDSFRKSGAWTDEHEKELEDQRALVMTLEQELSETKDKKAVAEKLSGARSKLYSLSRFQQELFSHSAEAKAEEAQRNYLVASVTETAEGSKVWSSYQEFLEEEDNGLVFTATYEYMTFSNGLNADFIDQLPENQVNKEDDKKDYPEPSETPVKAE